ncbi:MAG: hypothetical protein WC518_03935 [Patescibacteria group bacterium]
MTPPTKSDRPTDNSGSAGHSRLHDDTSSATLHLDNGQTIEAEEIEASLI